MSFDNFDPLEYSSPAGQDEAAIMRRVKRSIHSILHSYVGWYDPFAELIQNALDSVDKKTETTKKYKPKVSIIIDLKENSLTVSDNGIGLDENAFQRFLAPHESYKEGDERGSKGVGATYIAYGFNYIRIDSKTKNFSASGEMEDGSRWLHSANPSSNPQVFPTKTACPDSEFKKFNTGVSITLNFDETTRPGNLKWPNLKNADIWHKALSVKTALGAFSKNDEIEVKVRYISEEGVAESKIYQGISYLSPHDLMSKVQKYEDINEQVSKLIDKKGTGAVLPAKLKNLEAVYLDWNTDEIIQNVKNISKEEIAFCKKHDVKIIGSYMYGAGVWKKLAEKYGYRNTANIFGSGIQLAADNMPQGELIQIPLTRYTGRQNQVHIAFHFSNCVVDLGRKGFSKEIVDFSKSISSSIVQHNFSKIRVHLRSEDVKKAPLLANEKLANWKKSLEEHESNSPLILSNENFFLPLNEISVTSEPSREQDVIALFNQLLAGGVIRGIKIVGTNEMSTYDGAYRIRVGPSYDDHSFEETTNPLGIDSTKVDELKAVKPEGFVSTDMKVLEYKFSLDGLITDITTGDKKSGDMDLVVAWETGEDYEQYFGLESYLLEESREERQYHGVTHALRDEHGHHVMDVIILKDLINFLNNPGAEISNQEQYEKI